MILNPKLQILSFGDASSPWKFDGAEGREYGWVL